VSDVDVMAAIIEKHAQAVRFEFGTKVGHRASSASCYQAECTKCWRKRGTGVQMIVGSKP
jgi:hypothetical protein